MQAYYVSVPYQCVLFIVHTRLCDSMCNSRDSASSSVHVLVVSLSPARGRRPRGWVESDVNHRCSCSLLLCAVSRKLDNCRVIRQGSPSLSITRSRIRPKDSCPRDSTHCELVSRRILRIRVLVFTKTLLFWRKVYTAGFEHGSSRTPTLVLTPRGPGNWEIGQ